VETTNTTQMTQRTLLTKKNCDKFELSTRQLETRKGQAPPEVSYDTSEELHGLMVRDTNRNGRRLGKASDAAIGGDAFAVGYVAFLNTKPATQDPLGPQGSRNC
jgi:hypothetical protein